MRTTPTLCRCDPAWRTKQCPDGEKEGMTFAKSVNIYPDKPGRTLLAWRQLMVNLPFHAHWFYAAVRNHPKAVRGI